MSNFYLVEQNGGFFCINERTQLIAKKPTRNRFYLRRIVVYNNHKNVGIYGVHGAQYTVQNTNKKKVKRK